MARATTHQVEGDIPEADRLEGFPHPRERSTLVGHEAAEQVLLAAHASGRLHHAWLLAGPRGIGKATLAYRFARTLLKHPSTDAATELTSLQLDPEDSIFRQVMAMAHPDLVVLRPSYDQKTKRPRKQIVVEDVRKTKSFLTKTASRENGWRICLVDAVDDMNLASANALLKMLEEPPERAIFLLVSHVPGRLLATIRSRCRRLDLKALQADDIKAITNELSGSNPPQGDDMAQLILLAQGSAGKALAMTQNNGLQVYNSMMGLLETLPNLNLAALHTLADKLSARTGQAPQDFILFGELLCEWLARLTRANVVKAIVPDTREAALIAKLTDTATPADWANLWAEITHSLERTNALNLERKQFILQSFFNLEAVANNASLEARV